MATGLLPTNALAQTRGDPPDEPSASYPFLRDARDPVAVALSVLWKAQFRTYSSRDEAQPAFQECADAEAVVAREPERAAEYLLATLRSLAPDDAVGHASLEPLLRLVQTDPTLLTHMLRLLSLPPPEPPADGDGLREEVFSPGRQVRSHALAHLVRAAEQGSEQARTHLLTLLGNPDPWVRAGAVRGIYRAFPTRRQAQRQMRPRLMPEEQHLLYRY